VYLARVKRKPLVQEILPPIQDVYSDWLLRASALQTVEIEPRAESIAEIELLTSPNVRSGTNQQANRSCSGFMVVDTPSSGEIKASAGLIVPDPFWRCGRVLIEERKHLSRPRDNEEAAEGDEEAEVDCEPEQAPPKDDKALIDMINRAQFESTLLDLDPENLPDIDDIQFAHVSRLVAPKKGKWIRVQPPEPDDEGRSKSS
jgi:hypothetical protein